MTQPIIVHFTPVKSDYAAVLRLFFWQRRGTKISMAALLVVFGLVLAMLLSKGAPPTLFELVWLLLPPSWVVLLMLVQPARMANQAARTERLVSEVTWDISHAGIQVVSAFGSSRLGWETFDRLVKTRDYYLLIGKHNQNAFRFLPRRAFTSPQQDAAFVELVSSHVHKG